MKKASFLVLLLLIMLLPIPFVRADWLSGCWGKRIKITIDSDAVDTPLTYFPVLIYLSNSSGINNTDVSCIFDEVGANSLKIAVTEDDGTTELYVEIEKWDEANEEAWIWVSNDGWTISNSSNTELYIYYDIAHADNTAHVGAVESVSGEIVWDDNFKMVLHLSEDSGNFKDSTDNDNDATEQGDGVTRENELIDGTVRLAGTNDYLRQETAGLGSGWDDITFESWVKFHVLSGDKTVGSAWGGAAAEDLFFLFHRASENNMRWMVHNGVVAEHFYWSGDPAINTWHYFAGSRERDDHIYGYKNGVETQGPVAADLALDTYSYKPFFGEYTAGGKSLDGELDEIRISNVRRSSDWLEVTYETGKDNLLWFGEEERTIVTKLFGAGFVDEISPFARLHWTWEHGSVTLFEIQNSTDKISWDYLGSNTTTEYNDFQVINETERYYRVRACNFTGVHWSNSSFSDIDFEIVYFSIVSVADGVGARPEGWVLTIMIAIIGLALIILGTKRRR